MFKEYWKYIPLAMLAGAVAFPKRLVWDQFMKYGHFGPRLPSREDLEKNMDSEDVSNTYHWLKNILSELFRADPRWWAQCSAFMVFILALLCLVLSISK